jgi:hypothetical protein
MATRFKCWPITSHSQLPFTGYWNCDQLSSSDSWPTVLYTTKYITDIRHIAASSQMILTRSCRTGGPCTHPQEGFTPFYLNKIGRCSFSFPLPPPLTVQQLGGTFRVPELITSVQGVQFTSAVWTSLCIRPTAKSNVFTARAGSPQGGQRPLV